MVASDENSRDTSVSPRVSGAIAAERPCGRMSQIRRRMGRPGRSLTWAELNTPANIRPSLRCYRANATVDAGRTVRLPAAFKVEETARPDISANSRVTFLREERPCHKNHRQSKQRAAASY